MNDNFKLLINIGDSHIELEGEGALVHTIFSELRESGLGKLSSTSLIDKSFRQEDSEESPETKESTPLDSTEENSSFSGNLPNIRDIVIKNLPKIEYEWLLVYAFYCSKQGTETFTAKDLRQMYHDTDRYTRSRSTNFTANLKKCISKGYFTYANSTTDFTLSASGQDTALQILNRPFDETNNIKREK